MKKKTRKLTLNKTTVKILEHNERLALAGLYVPTRTNCTMNWPGNTTRLLCCFEP